MSELNSNVIDWPAALEKHQGWLKKILRCRVGDAHAVDDLFQEIALAVVRQSANSQSSSGRQRPLQNQSSHCPSDPEKVAPWLYRLAIRQSVNFYRRQNRKTQITPTVDLEAIDESVEPLDWMLAKEQSQHLHRAIKLLGPHQQEILTLKYSENWSYQQMADHLGVPVRSIEYRLLQARKQLRSLVVTNIATNNSTACQESGSIAGEGY